MLRWRKSRIFSFALGRFDAGRDRCGLSTGRAAGRTIQVPGVIRSTGEQIVALNPIGKFRKVGLRKQNAPCLFQPRNAGRIRGRRSSFEDRRSALGPHHRGVD